MLVFEKRYRGNKPLVLRETNNKKRNPQMVSISGLNPSNMVGGECLDFAPLFLFLLG